MSRRREARRRRPMKQWPAGWRLRWRWPRTRGRSRPGSRARTSAVRRPGTSSELVPDMLEKVGIDQKLNAQVPLDAGVPRRERPAGEARRLLRQAAGRADAGLLRVPDALHAGAQRRRGGVQGDELHGGEEFEVVTVSFNPKETPAMAAAKKDDLPRRSTAGPQAATGWHFLTGDQPAIDALATRSGFRYVFDQASQQYVHASAIMVLTPQGRVSKYFYGIEYPPKDLRLGLIEASGGKIGTPVDQVLLYCYHYDPHSGKYSMVVMNVLRLAGVATVALIGGFIAAMWSRDRRKSKTRRGRGAAGVAVIAYASDPDSAARRPPPWRPRWTPCTSSWSRSRRSSRCSSRAWWCTSRIKYRRQLDGRGRRAHPRQPDARGRPGRSSRSSSCSSSSAGARASSSRWRGRRPGRSTSTWSASSGCGSSSTPTATPRSTSCTCPVGTTVKLTMTSQDVIHDMYIPDFRVKADVLPGRYTHLWFKATKPGPLPPVLRRVLRHEPLGDDRLGRGPWSAPSTSSGWPAAPGQGTMAQTGEKLFKDLSCITCHKEDTTGRGPTLDRPVRQGRDPRQRQRRSRPTRPTSASRS